MSELQNAIDKIVADKNLFELQVAKFNEIINSPVGAGLVDLNGVPIQGMRDALAILISGGYDFTNVTDGVDPLNAVNKQQLDTKLTITDGVATFMNKTPVTLPAGTDLNTVTGSGIYYIADNQDPGLNHPTQPMGFELKRHGFLVVLGRIGFAKQTYYLYNRDEPQIRSFSGTWSSWKVQTTNVSRVIDLSHLATDKFYPVYFSASSLRANRYKISRQYNIDTNAGGVSEGNPLMGLFMDFTFIGDTWGGNPINMWVHSHLATYNAAVGAIGFVSRYKACVYLRGGYRYWQNVDAYDSLPTIIEVAQANSVTANTSIGPITVAEADAALTNLGTTELRDTNKSVDLGALQLGGLI